jgi:cyclopropane-fatty-acyl-phospholipid synthase
VSALERWIARKLLELRGHPPVRLVLWTGEEIGVSDEPPVARIVIRDPKLLRGLLTRGELCFGDAYSDGRIEVEGDLVRMLKILFDVSGGSRLERMFLRLLSRSSNRNTLRGSRKNIHRHYDLGNDFYKLWLDERMVYTCAYFPTRETTLEEAQLAKMEHVCRKVALRPGDRVVEAGCGWGSLALYMARNHGATVRAYNISQEQVDWAREQAQRGGLADRVEFIADDYRNISGTYDVFMSVGMLEHVGKENYRELGRIIDRSLHESGRGLIHSIGRHRPRPLSAWIEQRIFPGSYSPTLREMVEFLEPFDFAVLDVENLRLHYEKTLEHWLERFEKNADAVGGMFDERFTRAWRLYLSGSIAAFHTSSLQLFQVAFARTRRNELPWTRANLYAD